MKAFDPNYKLLDEMYQDDYYPMTSSAVVTEMSGRNKRRRDRCISKNTGATLSEARMTA